VVPPCVALSLTVTTITEHKERAAQHLPDRFVSGWRTRKWTSRKTIEQHHGGSPAVTPAPVTGKCGQIMMSQYLGQRQIWAFGEFAESGQALIAK